FDIAPIAILVAHDPECRNITANRVATTFLGVPSDANLTMSGVAPADALFRIRRDGVDLRPEELSLQRAAASGSAIEPEELELVLPDGRSFGMYASAAPIVRDGTVVGAIGAFL